MNRIIKKVVIKLISFYQHTLSPDHGFPKAHYPHGFCRYYPSCSEYAKQAIIKRGLWSGGVKSLFRLLRCNPFSPGGIDLP